MTISIQIKCADCDHIGEIQTTSEAVVSQEAQVYMVNELKARNKRGHEMGHHKEFRS